MRLIWSGLSLRRLGEIAERAPVQAKHVQQSVEALVRLPFPGMYRRVEERLDLHVLSVPPHAVFYVIEGDDLKVLTIIDSRRRKEPW